MKQFYLVEIVTKDKLVHQGIYFAPKKPRKRAILWVHGLTDNFYGDMGILEAFVDTLGEEGWGIASFNTRGHDVIASVKKIDRTTPKGHTSLTLGASYENFSECICDIEAGISFLARNGFDEVVIAGISTGANKVCYYAGTQKDPRIAGILLVSPLSDVPIESRSKHYKDDVKRMKALMKQKKGESLISDISYMPLTPSRYLSLFDPGGNEDVFDYYSPQPKLSAFSRIQQPLCVVLAGSDEYTDRPVIDILHILKEHTHSSNFQGSIIPDAFHSFGGKERVMIDSILQWMKKI
ncbi:MAG: DUF1749 domain-containing protein [Patescibacteria group bacterium]